MSTHAMEKAQNIDAAAVENQSWFKKFLKLSPSQIREGGVSLAKTVAKNLTWVATKEAIAEGREMSDFMHSQVEAIDSLVSRRHKMLESAARIKESGGEWGKEAGARINSSERTDMLETLSELRSYIAGLPKDEKEKQRKVLAKMLWANRTRHEETRAGIQKSISHEEWNQRLEVAQKASTPIILALGIGTGGVAAGSATGVRAGIDVFKRVNTLLEKRHAQHARSKSEQQKITPVTLFLHGFLEWGKAVMKGDLQAVMKGVGYGIGGGFLTDALAFDGAGRNAAKNAVLEVASATWSRISDFIAPPAAAQSSESVGQTDAAGLLAAGAIADRTNVDADSLLSAGNVAVAEGEVETKGAVAGDGVDAAGLLAAGAEAAAISTETPQQKLMNIFGETVLKSKSDKEEAILLLQPLFGAADLQVSGKNNLMDFIIAEKVTPKTVADLIPELRLDLKVGEALNLNISHDNGRFRYTLERADGIKLAAESNLLAKVTPGGIPLAEYSIANITVDSDGAIENLLILDTEGNADQVTLNQLVDPEPDGAPDTESVDIATTRAVLAEFRDLNHFGDLGYDRVQARLKAAGFSEEIGFGYRSDAFQVTNLNAADQKLISQLFPVVQGEVEGFQLSAGGRDINPGVFKIFGSDLELSTMPIGAADWSQYSIKSISFSPDDTLHAVETTDGEFLYQDSALTEVGSVGVQSEPRIAEVVSSPEMTISSSELLNNLSAGASPEAAKELFAKFGIEAANVFVSDDGYVSVDNRNGGAGEYKYSAGQALDMAKLSELMGGEGADVLKGAQGVDFIDFKLVDGKLVPQSVLGEVAGIKDVEEIKFASVQFTDTGGFGHGTPVDRNGFQNLESLHRQLRGVTGGSELTLTDEGYNLEGVRTYTENGKTTLEGIPISIPGVLENQSIGMLQIGKHNILAFATEKEFDPTKFSDPLLSSGALNFSGINTSSPGFNLFGLRTGQLQSMLSTIPEFSEISLDEIVSIYITPHDNQSSYNIVLYGKGVNLLGSSKGPIALEQLVGTAGSSTATGADDSARRHSDRQVYNIVSGGPAEAAAEANSLEGIAVSPGMEATATSLIEAGYGGFDRIAGVSNNNPTLIYEKPKMLPILNQFGIEHGGVEQITLVDGRPRGVFGIGLRINPDLIPDTRDANLLAAASTHITGVVFAADGSLERVTATVKGAKFDNILAASNAAERTFGVEGTERAPDRAPAAESRPARATVPQSRVGVAELRTAEAGSGAGVTAEGLVAAGAPVPTETVLETKKYAIKSGDSVTQVLKKQYPELFKEATGKSWNTFIKTVNTDEVLKQTAGFNTNQDINQLAVGQELRLDVLAAEYAKQNGLSITAESAPVISEGSKITVVPQSGDTVTDIFNRYIESNKLDVSDTARDAAIAAVGANTESLVAANITSGDVDVIYKDTPINLQPFIDALENPPAPSAVESPAAVSASPSSSEQIGAEVVRDNLSAISERVRSEFDSNLTNYWSDFASLEQELLNRMPQDTVTVGEAEQWLESIAARDIALSSVLGTESGLTTDALQRIKIIGIDTVSGVPTAQLDSGDLNNLPASVQERLRSMLNDIVKSADSQFIASPMSVGTYLETKSLRNELRLGYNSGSQTVTYNK